MAIFLAHPAGSLVAIGKPAWDTYWKVKIICLWLCERVGFVRHEGVIQGHIQGICLLGIVCVGFPRSSHLWWFKTFQEQFICKWSVELGMSCFGVEMLVNDKSICLSHPKHPHHHYVSIADTLH
jgi:hypothetical protein